MSTSTSFAADTRRTGERDLYDLPLSTGPAAAELFREAQSRVLRVHVGAELPLREAVWLDPDFALGHAALAVLAHDLDLPLDAIAHVNVAERMSANATAWERSFVAAAYARVHGTSDQQARLLHHLAQHPRDALALNVAVPTIAFAGTVDVADEAWSLLEAARPVFGAEWWFDGLLAFARQEQGRFAEAADLATGSLAAEPAGGHAAHAMTHVLYETGRHEEGLRWMDGWIDAHADLAFHPSHYSWHAALHELALGDTDAVRRRFVRDLGPDVVQGVRALVDSASLLWRARIAGAWPDDLPIDDVLAVVDDQLLRRSPSPFVAMHAAVALAAAGDGVGLRLLGRQATLDGRASFRELVAPLAAAMTAVVERRPDNAAEILLRLMPDVEKFGGSKAQREVVEQTLVYALVEADRLTPAQRLVQHALDRRMPPTRQAG